MSDTIRVEFDSLAEMVAAIERAPEPKQNVSRSTEADYMQFNGDASFADAMAMARHGWADGAARAKALLDRINVPGFTAVRSETQHDVTGAYVDVGAFVEGAPECMVDFVADRRPRRFAHIIVAGNYSHRVTPEQAMARGVTIAAIVDVLESRGIRCTVDVETNTRGFENRSMLFQTAVTIKHASAPLNLDALVFSCAHPAFLRRLIFAVRELQPMDVRKPMGFHSDGSYGMAQKLDVSGRPDALVFQTPGHEDAWDLEYSIAKVQEALLQFEENAR